jgi:hypothetical protein
MAPLLPETVRVGIPAHAKAVAAAGAAERDALFECTPCGCFHLTAADCCYGEQFAYFAWARLNYPETLAFLAQQNDFETPRPVVAFLTTRWKPTPC